MKAIAVLLAAFMWLTVPSLASAHGNGPSETVKVNCSGVKIVAQNEPNVELRAYIAGTWAKEENNGTLYELRSTPVHGVVLGEVISNDAVIDRKQASC